MRSIQGVRGQKLVKPASFEMGYRSCMSKSVNCAPSYSFNELSLSLIYVRFAVTRFRLRQSHHADGATWAIRHLYVGEQCPDMCRGHGVCQEGLCR